MGLFKCLFAPVKFIYNAIVCPFRSFSSEERIVRLDKDDDIPYRYLAKKGVRWQTIQSFEIEYRRKAGIEIKTKLPEQKPIKKREEKPKSLFNLIWNKNNDEKTNTWNPKEKEFLL